MNFGVSPAWFLSLYGEAFSVLQAGESLGLLSSLGFTNWQPEIFLEDGLDEWVSGKADDLRKRSLDLGLKTDIFVAHFLGTGFSNESSLESGEWTIKLKSILDVLDPWTDLSIIAVPLPSFQHESPDDFNFIQKVSEGFCSRLSLFAALVESSGRRLALEVMPGNLVGDSRQIADLLRREGMENVGINYDTGHFHAAGESQKDVLRNLGSRIIATHLCDNDGITNLSLPPGDGNISWEDVVGGLNHTEYSGSYDIEILCLADTVETAYTRGRDHLKRNLLEESA